MATLHFGTADRKIFTPISAALGALSNGPGTIITLFKTTNAGGTDYAGLTNAAVSSYYHALSKDNNGFYFDDDQPVAVTSTTLPPTDTTNWWMNAVDWPLGTAQTERLHWRNQTGAGAGLPGSWTHDAASAANTGQRAGPGTSGWWTLGFFGDWNIGQKDMAVVAAYDVRFADSDYTDVRKTSDLYNHALGHPIFLCQLTATTLVDLIGGSTYSSANSSGTTLTGADPDNWTMDGIGSAVAKAPPHPIMRRFPRAMLIR